jgi:hypothetical protein
MSKSTRFGLSGRGQRVELAIRPHRAWWVQALLILWRWSFELAVAVALVVVYVQLTESMPPLVAVLVMCAPVVIVLGIPWSRRQVLGWFWCTVTRHRLRALFVAVRLTNGHGKLPWLLLVRPTPVGERALCLMVAGLSVTDLENRTEAVAATCWARSARITRSPRWAALVWIDVVRRDPLAAKKPLGSELLVKASRFGRLHTDPTKPAPPPTPLVEPIPSAPKPAKTPAQRTPTSDGPSVVVHGEDLSDYV